MKRDEDIGFSEEKMLAQYECWLIELLFKVGKDVSVVAILTMLLTQKSQAITQ